MTRSTLQRSLPGLAQVTISAFGENSRVALTSEVEMDDGIRLPAGSTGTVVGVWAKGEAYEIEFTTPYHAVLTVIATKLSAAGSAL